MEIRTKSQAATLFGNQSRLAEALGITHQAVSRWPEELPDRIRQRVVGVAFEKGLIDRKSIRTT